MRGGRNSARQLERSAEAVHVVDLREAREQTADLGEVLARTQGISVRRGGGLGSSTRFSLNGLSSEQIRFLFDGVPLQFSGYPFGIANIPVNLVRRAEVYRGVVPIRFGADALGGAVNLVSAQRDHSHLGASYQVGSFGTHRLSLHGRYRHEPSGFVAGGTAFFDRARNDYLVDVQATDAVGNLLPGRETIRRFHDGYQAQGGTAEVGFVDQPWARRLLLTAYAASYQKELQHNATMEVPYGEVRYGESVYGATSRYEVALAPKLDLELLVAYARRNIEFVDKAAWVYNWRGERVRPRRQFGELDADDNDRITWDDNGFARVNLAWTLTRAHILRASVSPAYVMRTGEERTLSDPTMHDPLTARRSLFTLVSRTWRCGAPASARSSST